MLLQSFFLCIADCVVCVSEDDCAFIVIVAENLIQFAYL